ncbi:STAS domain-containing protein [Streptomyces sp. NPDC006530]|uniref:STAS domain-containing protein n=1 Tax=Streptomyces sp. NPDC006530 TaxID=3364750 RepID=UPI0036906FE7
MFSVQVSGVEQGMVFALRGELDFDSMVQLHEAGERELLKGRGAGPVVIDCSGLLFCDSSGVSALLWLHRQLSAQGRALRLAAMPARVSRLFALTGLDVVLSVYADVAGALGSNSRVIAAGGSDGPAQPNEELSA